MARIRLESGTPAELVQASEPRGGLVLFPDIGGLRPLFDEHCARISREWGLTVCAPEPFPGQEDLELSQRLEAAKDKRDEQMLGDAFAAAERIGANQTFVMGFCMGGMYTLKAAADERFAKAVSFYGMIRVPDQWQGPGHAEPLELLADRGASHVLMLMGTEDPWVSVSDGEALRELGAEVVVYDGADHGFVHDPDRPSHRPDDAADAWQRAKAFLLG